MHSTLDKREKYVEDTHGNEQIKYKQMHQT